jgi:tetratricopeptide (TPR) repeat protein
MAINKSHTTPFVKGVIIAIAFLFILAMVAAAFSGLGGTYSGTPTASQTASQSTTATVAALAQAAQPAIQAREASLTADPKNYALLVQQGQAYFDWAQSVLQATQAQLQASPGAPRQDTPYWKLAIPYYRRALSIKTGDPNVMTDYSTALFYSGDTTTAISVGVAVQSLVPTFTPVAFNLGIYYESTGQNAKAKAAFQDYLRLAPNGPNAAAAKQELTKL